MKLFLIEKHTIKKSKEEIVLDKLEYNISDEQLMVDNHFLKCSKCKNYFDSIRTFGEFHPLYKKYEEKQFCEKCFSVVNKL